MKYVLIVPDGMADYKIDELGGLSALEYARTPNMDALAKNGIVGRVHTIPDGLPPGSDVAALSIMGYDPKMYYTGRAPLEAASQSIELKSTDVVFRCNLINTDGEHIVDYSGGEISTLEAKELIKALGENLGNSRLKFYPGVSYRHLLVDNAGSVNIKCTPPHDVMGQKIADYLPKGENEEMILELIFRSHDILKAHPVNLARESAGKRPANMAWFWGQGYKPNLTSFAERFNVSGTVISAVDLIRGIALTSGLKAPEIIGASGTVNTNWKGKQQAAIDALDCDDFVMLHLEAPDESGHQGSLSDKIKSIELVDSEIVGPVIERAKTYGDYRVLILPDHYTPISLRTHVGDAVPFLLSGSGVESKDSEFGESYAENNAKMVVKAGHELINELFK